MKCRIVLFLGLCLLPSTASGGELSKPYFGSTLPGSWARHQMIADRVDPYTYVYRRLPDAAGLARIEIEAVFSGQLEGTWSRSTYTFEKSFDPSRDMLSHARFLKDAVLEAAGTGRLPQDAGTVKAIREGSTDYRGAMTFVGTEEIEGRRCDRYAYEARSQGAAPTVEIGDVWLDPTVPFGIVRQVATLKDARSGELRSRYTMTLAESGVGDAPSVAGEPEGRSKEGEPAAARDRTTQRRER